MKKYAVILLLPFTISSCRNKNQDKVITSYPADYENVLNAHGGLHLWDKARTLSFTIDSTDHFVTDTKDRRERVRTPIYEIGNDGDVTWSKPDSTHRPDPVFLKNLMFYFFAMPFVLADQGVIFSETPAKTIQGQEYSGIKVSYQDSVGHSPKDEYYLYYDRVSGQMTWLAYSVTYFSKEKSEELSWIKYDQFQSISSLVFPQKLIWYKSDENGPTDVRSIRVFTNVSLQNIEKNATFYTAPASAVIVK